VNANANGAEGPAPVDSPATEHPRFDAPKPAPAFVTDTRESEGFQGVAENGPAADGNELARVLLKLLEQGRLAPEKQRGATRPSWDRRRALVCVPGVNAQILGNKLLESNYQVYVAEDTTQAIERMREEYMDVVILDQDFDPVEQGVAFVMREVNTMPPAERRRLFFVQISAACRTLDAHVAFLNNVNLMVNPADIEELPLVLDRSMRDFNELYRGFNGVLNLTPL
jgi:hypothetical protein